MDNPAWCFRRKEIAVELLDVLTKENNNIRVGRTDLVESALQAVRDETREEIASKTWAALRQFFIHDPADALPEVIAEHIRKDEW